MDNFHLFDEIGKGKYSTVYKGRKKKTLHYVAIKSVEKCHKPKILNEVRIMHGLNHSNILRFFNWYETTNHLWLILEYCTGGDLLTLLKQDAHLTEETIKGFGRSLMTALQYLHSSGILYCDLKPSNVLLDEAGELKLCDFGLARTIKETGKGAKEATKGRRRGTPCYMAPELFEDDHVYGYQSDFWALGCVLYEMAMGRPPFLSKSFSELVEQILYQDPDPLSDASEHFCDLLEGLLMKDPQERFSWEELRNHPFWEEPLEVLDIPPHNAYETFIKKRAELMETKTQECTVNADARPRTADVDVVRLSQIVQTNMKLEEGEQGSSATEGYGTARKKVATPEDEKEKQQPKGKDELPSADMEVDFEEPQQEGVDSLSIDEEEEEKSAPPRPAHTARESPSPAHEGKVSAHSGAHSQSEAELEAERAETPLPRPGVQQQEDMDVSLISVLFHPSEDQIRPIVHNKKIEKLPALGVFDPSTLPMRALGAEELLGLQTQEQVIEHLSTLYRTVGGHTTLAEKMNALGYIESIITDEEVASIFVNSSMSTLLVKIAKSSKSNSLRCRVVTLLGLLVRYAKRITDEVLPRSAVLQVLTEALREGRNTKLKRASAAALGEILFFVSTELFEGVGSDDKPLQASVAPDGSINCSSGWSIPGGCLSTITKALRTADDEVAQHYLVKLIENIATYTVKQSPEVLRMMGELSDEERARLALVARLCSTDTGVSMLALIKGAKSEGLRATSAAALARICLLDTSMAVSFVEKLSVSVAVALALSDNSLRIQHSFSAVLGLAMLQPPPRLIQSLMNEEKERGKSAGSSREGGVVWKCIRVLEHSTSPISKGKSLALLLCMCRANAVWLKQSSDLKLFVLMERLLKDKDVFLSAAARWASVAMAECLKIAMETMLQEEPSRAESRGGSASRHGDPEKKLGKHSQLSVLSHALQSGPRCRKYVFSATAEVPSDHPFIKEGHLQEGCTTAELLAFFIAHFVANNLHAASPASKKYMPLILDGVGQFAADLFEALPEIVLQWLIRPLASIVVEGDNELRFAAVKSLLQVSVVLVDSTKGGNATVSSAQAVQSLVEQLHSYLKGRWESLLEEKALLSLYLLKMLDVVAGAAEKYGKEQSKHSMVDVFWQEGVAALTLARVAEAKPSSSGGGTIMSVSAIAVRMYDQMEATAGERNLPGIKPDTVWRCFSLCVDCLSVREGEQSDDERIACCALISALCGHIENLEDPLLATAVDSIMASGETSEGCFLTETELDALLSLVRHSSIAAGKLDLKAVIALVGAALKSWEPSDMQRSAEDDSAEALVLLAVGVLDAGIAEERKAGKLAGDVAESAKEMLESISRHPLISESLAEAAMSARAKLRVLR
uniref:Protein kinase domain-containing protein n=1 Tax=Palpitomonas bilix TaxID=652834 RepID=A0A7S3G1Y3_9EUKA|mmetsp:Transcript_18807/g.47712  ORF Transcript_18807/g.47712 Transcript_18807/m.47712 type:complete len:1367 (+) Transcript_18807:69-4169(+)